MNTAEDGGVGQRPSTCRSLMVTSALCIDRFLRGQARGADVCQVDLEDGVPGESKEEARRCFLSLRPEQISGRLSLRINSLHTRAGLEDLLAVLTSEAEPESIVLPKVESPEQIELADSVLTAAGRSSRLWAVLETARGVSNAMAIAASGGRLAALCFGLGDFAADLGASLGWDAMVWARSQIVSAARAAGIAAVDGPTFDLHDTELLRTEASKSADMGFSGKIVLHPKQIAIVNEAYRPNPRDLEWARQVLEKFEKTPHSVHVVAGGMVGPPFLRRAREILAAARP